MSILVSQTYFYVPEFAPGPLLLKLSCLNSIESEVATKKLLFSGRLFTEPKMTPLIINLFNGRNKSFLDSDIPSLILPSHWRNLIFSITLKHGITAPFPYNPNWKNIVRDSIIRFEKSAWHSYCE